MKKENIPVTSFDIKSALARRHANEFFITECKDGPSQFGAGMKQFDAVAIYKSWTNPNFRIYEIKVSRSDFQRDAKYRTYIPYCNELIIACPQGMIDRNELPPEVGLHYYNPKTGLFITKQKPIWRNIDIDASMLMYIFMNRLDSERPPFGSNKAEYLRQWVENKENNRQLGHRVKSKMGLEISRLTDELDELRDRASDRDELAEIDNVLNKHGERYLYGKGARAKAIKELLSHGYPKQMDDIDYHLDAIVETIASIKNANNQVSDRE